MKIVRNMRTKKARAFWASCKKDSRDMRKWPKWRRAGINVKHMS